jgi:hypothetical protein
MVRLRFSFFLVAAFLFAAPAYARIPAWIASLAERPATMDYGDASHVVLTDEADLTVDKNGLVTRRSRYALKVLTRDGRDAALARLSYETSSDKVRSFQAWLVPSTGKPIEYGKKHTVDTAVYANARELYGESRQLVISGYDDATPGAIFAYEAITTEKSIYTQEVWFFQQSAPVEYSAITLTLPDGWTAQARTFNRAPIEPVTSGKTQTWALEKLSAKTKEPLAPPRRAHTPWLAIDYTPPSGLSLTRRVSLPSWAALSTYFSPHYENASTPDAALKAKADSLVAGAATPWDRIVRLCRFAQAVNYISINLNHAEAGGMIPRPAPRVLQCNYGDCKDKTTLLRALLRSQGVESYPVIVYSGDPSHVRNEWVSPMQFNHCIIAIKVDDSISAPGVVTHPTLGRLLVFDPTNESTPPGWLAEEDLSGLGLVLAGANGELIRLPSLSPEQNRFERTITARLEPSGAISGTLTENFHGNSSAEARDEYKSVSATDFRTQVIERWLARTLTTPRATRVEVSDKFDDARFSLAVDFDARAYGKSMRDTLLVFKPVIVARRDNITLKKGKRIQPVIISPSSFIERTEITLPDGFRVDEPFPPAELISSFGRYQAKAEVRDNLLIFERALELRATALPAEEYETARVFFEKLLQAEQSPVVLKRL